MKFIIVLAFIATLACVYGQQEFRIPDSLKAEGDALMKTLDALNLPKTPDGKHPDVCKITDATLKAQVFAFITKVNAAGGSLPVPPCT
uniref:CSON007130 protein n=1 Tax=Culicoides sonorensis TaxID=179676 RepID=A0A336MTP0_CULSO